MSVCWCMEVGRAEDNLAILSQVLPILIILKRDLLLAWCSLNWANLKVSPRNLPFQARTTNMLILQNGLWGIRKEFTNQPITPNTSRFYLFDFWKWPFPSPHFLCSSHLEASILAICSMYLPLSDIWAECFCKLISKHRRDRWSSCRKEAIKNRTIAQLYLWRGLRVEWWDMLAFTINAQWAKRSRENSQRKP